MKALKRRVVLKPIIMLELAVIVLLAGIGVAFAIASPTALDDTPVWLGTTGVQDANLNVSDYSLNFDVGLANLVSVNVTVENDDSGNTHSGTITLDVIASGVVFQTETATTGVVTFGTPVVVTVTMSPVVAVTNLDGLDITIEQD